MATVIEHRRFTCIDATHNKVWEYTLYDNDDLMVAWGRIGSKLQTKTHIGVGPDKAMALVRSKENKGYEEVDVD